jgi:hypothetical protein
MFQDLLLIVLSAMETKMDAQKQVLWVLVIANTKQNSARCLPHSRQLWGCQRIHNVC